MPQKKEPFMVALAMHNIGSLNMAEVETASAHSPPAPKTSAGRSDTEVGKPSPVSPGWKPVIQPAPKEAGGSEKGFGLWRVKSKSKCGDAKSKDTGKEKEKGKAKASIGRDARDSIMEEARTDTDTASLLSLGLGVPAEEWEREQERILGVRPLHRRSASPGLTSSGGDGYVSASHSSLVWDRDSPYAGGEGERETSPHIELPPPQYSTVDPIKMHARALPIPPVSPAASSVASAYSAKRQLDISPIPSPFKPLTPSSPTKPATPASGSWASLPKHPVLSERAKNQPDITNMPPYGSAMSTAPSPHIVPWDPVLGFTTAGANNSSIGGGGGVISGVALGGVPYQYSYHYQFQAPVPAASSSMSSLTSEVSTPAGLHGARAPITTGEGVGMPLPLPYYHSHPSRGPHYEHEAGSSFVPGAVPVHPLPVPMLPTSQSSSILPTLNKRKLVISEIRADDPDFPLELEFDKMHVRGDSGHRGGSIEGYSGDDGLESVLRWRDEKRQCSRGGEREEREEAVIQWCHSFGEVQRVEQREKGSLVVEFVQGGVVESVCRMHAQVYIEGVGSVNLSWC